MPKLQQKCQSAVFFSASKQTEEKASRFVFDDPARGLVFRSDVPSAACVVKPHCLLDGNLGHVVNSLIEGGMQIGGIRLCTLTRKQAAEFLEVYDGVLPGFYGMVDEMSSGPCVAIQIVGDGGVVSRLRKLAGPIEFSTAKALRPQSLRALYGKSAIQTAVHVTDLEDDGVLETEYLFEILPNA